MPFHSLYIIPNPDYLSKFHNASIDVLSCNSLGMAPVMFNWIEFAMVLRIKQSNVPSVLYSGADLGGGGLGGCNPPKSF